MNLTEKAMLVKFTRTAFSAKKFDKKVTQEVDDAHGSHDAGRYNKALIAKSALESGQKASNEARTFVYEQTLPWSDEGYRILTAANYLPFTQSMRAKIASIEKADQEFISRYPEYIEEAKVRLNSLFNPLDYPDTSKIGKYFSVSIQFSPLPTSQDFRVNLSSEDIEAIQRDIELRVKDATQEAVKDLWNRLYENVSHMVEKLSEPEAIFRDTLINNIKDLCELLPRLNLTDDPDLNRMGKEIKDRLTNFSPEELRPNATKDNLEKKDREMNRRQTAQEAKKILDEMSAYFTPATN
jgi:hypothetical protein